MSIKTTVELPEFPANVKLVLDDLGTCVFLLLSIAGEQVAVFEKGQWYAGGFLRGLEGWGVSMIPQSHRYLLMKNLTGEVLADIIREICGVEVPKKIAEIGNG